MCNIIMWSSIGILLVWWLVLFIRLMREGEDA